MNLTKIVWILITGILLVRMALFMSYPFLAFHLKKLSFDAIDIGLILGCHYFFAGITGILGGNIADRWNPKKALILTLLIGSLAFLGLSQAKSFNSFLFCNILLAISTAAFEPIASILITTNVSADLHILAFRYRYMAINAGAALGPCIGALLMLRGSSFSFLSTSILLAFYSFLFIFLKLENKKEIFKNKDSSAKLREVLKYMIQHKSFLFLITANLFVTMTYGQIFSTFPQILNAAIPDGHRLYSILLTINPFTVIMISLFFNRFLSKQNPKILFNIGSLLLAISFLGFHFFSITYPNYVFFMILFTFAEMSLIPTTSKFLFDLAPSKYRGAYLGSESSSYLGFFIGNLVGGFLLKNGKSVFAFCIFCAIASFFLYRLASSKQTPSIAIE